MAALRMYLIDNLGSLKTTQPIPAEITTRGHYERDDSGLFQIGLNGGPHAKR
jgi:hypothetical protein